MLTPMSTTTNDNKNTDKSPRQMLVVLTSHEELGDTGKSTGFHLAELTHVLAMFDARGIPYTLASIDGGEPPMDARDESDDINKTFLEDDEQMARLKSTEKLSDVDPSEFAGVYFPGGHGTMWDLPNDETVAQCVTSIWDAGGLVSSICHGPAAFVGVKDSSGDFLVKGKRMTCFSDSEERGVELEDVVPFLLQSKLEEQGAIVEPGEDGELKVIADGNLITGQNPASAKALGEAIAQALVQMVPASSL